jgi:threonine dehydratase
MRIGALPAIPRDRIPEHRLSLAAIRRALDVIDPVFLGSPQYRCEPLNDALECYVTLKLETANPIRSFKGRGASFLIRERAAALRGRQGVGASAGNWGQALAYVCREAGLPITLFASVNASPFKIERMRQLGAAVRLAGEDFDAAKVAAETYARETDGVMLADGLDKEAAEGAGTMAIELLAGTTLDAIVVPLGNGAMLTGIARWAHAVDPAIEIIGVQAKGADAMERSWRSGTLVFPPSISTIADGIGVRVPIAEAVADMSGIVSAVHLVDDDAIIAAMRLLFRKAGLITEPSGAAGLAALISRPAHFRGRRVAAIICGSNITDTQMRDWLLE